MDRNNMFTINQMIYQIYNMEDLEKMKVELMTQVKNVLSCICVSILMANKDTGKLCDPVCVPSSYVKMEQSYLSMQELEWGSWITKQKRSLVVSSSELMPEKERVKTAFYQRSYKPFGVHYSAYLTFVNKNEFLGILTVYRTKEQGDFSSEDLFILQLLSEHLNARFYREKYQETSIWYKRKKLGSYIRNYGLTEREAEVMDLIFNGKTNEEISKELFISVSTIKKHLQNIYRKTGVSGKAELLSLM